MRLSLFRRSFLRRISDSIMLWWRVFLLFWKLNPWLLLPIVSITIIAGVIPGIQVLLTCTLTQHAALAIAHGGDRASLTRLFVIMGIQGLVVLFTLALGSIQQYVQNLLQMQISN